MTTGYFKIINKGEIEPEAFTLIGASTKRGDSSKIGFFGSGLKYAIAVLMREEIPFKVYSGSKEIKITVKKSSLRGQSFDVIHINGRPTSLTTSMGITWQAWFAVREIFCNAVDEGNHEIGIAGEPEPIKGNTVFYIGINEKLKQVLNNWDKYFSDKRSDLVHKAVGVKFFQGGAGSIVYRKGIQVLSDEKLPSLYHYDCEDLDINESRVLESDYEWKHKVGIQFARHASTSMIKNLLMNWKGKMEEAFYWEDMGYGYSRNWVEAIGDRYLVPNEYGGNFLEEIGRVGQDRCIVLPSRMIETLKNRFTEEIKVIGKISEDGYSLKEPNEKQKQLIDKAKEFLLKSGIECDYPILIAHFNNNRILGRAKNATIELSPKLFDLGMKMIVAVILEEITHLQTGYNDETREFQNYLFMKLVGFMEEKNKTYL